MNLPNKITLSRIFLIPIFIFILSIPFEWGTITLIQNEIPVTNFISSLIFIIASGTDWLDGYIATKYGLITNLGKFLDPLVDKLLVAAALILLIEIKLAPACIVIIILSREFAVTGLRLVAAGAGLDLATSHLGTLKTVSHRKALM